MEQFFDKKSLLKAMKDMYVVSTQSGPVVPSKTQTIKVLKDQILDPVSAPQDREKWDRRTYDKNTSLLTGFNVEDLYKKVVMEATSKTEYKGMRLNLQSIDMKRSHCKFVVERQGHETLIEIYYPNVNGNITAKLITDDHLSELYEVPLDSPQFQVNFGFTILKSIDKLRKESGQYSVTDDLNTQQILNGMGSAVYDVNQSNIQPGAMLRESVDYNLAGLMNLCNAVLEAEGDGDDQMAGDGAGEQAPGAQAFNAPGGDQDPMAELADTANGPGDVNGTDDKTNDTVNLRDALVDPASTMPNEDRAQIINADGSNVNGEKSEVDNLAKMVSEMLVQRKADDGYKPKLGSNDIYNGFTGLKTESERSLWEKFFEENETLGNLEVPTSKVKELHEYLQDPGVSELTYDRFTHKLAELFPEAYNGGKPKDDVMSVADLSTPGDDIFSAGNGMDGMAGLAGSAGGDEAATVPDFGNAATPDYMNDGSTAELVDAFNSSDTGEGEGTEGGLPFGFSEDTGLPTEGETQDNQAAAKTSAAAALPGI